MTTIGVYTEFSECGARAQQLAKELSLPLLAAKTEADYMLVVTPDYIGLQQSGSKSKPLYVDFLSKKMIYRRQHASLKREKIARAMGLKSKNPLTIVDATAGLGRDGFILAALGFEVTLLERSPIVFTLLADGIARAQKDPGTAPIMQRFKLVKTDAFEWMHKHDKRTQPGIIYLDPMYPSRRKSALVKKEMRIFHDIIGSDEDAGHLLPAALSCATNRVVVKRARFAENLGGLLPDYTQEGSSSRFDVYLI
jgi:16S rRNA (guanine1516-N2)-methyltransferase